MLTLIITTTFMFSIILCSLYPTLHYIRLHIREHNFLNIHLFTVYVSFALQVLVFDSLHLQDF